MTLTLDFALEDEAWAEAAPWYRELALRAAEQAFAAAGIDPREREISVLLCGDARIAALNAGFRGKTAPTNVLSWPAFPLRPARPGAPPPPAPPGFLGDVALARETVEAEAAERGLPVERHFAHLFAHGVFHLLGYDHETDEDAALMESLERRALAAMGIPDPYADGAE